MEMRQIRYFVAVVEAGSLLKASARLHIAQPALGQQIAALEEDLGARLFHRSSRGMQLTEAGKTFYEHANVLLHDIERARAAVQEIEEKPRGEVAIGLPATVSLIATVHIVRACREQFPLIRLKLVEAYSGFLKEWLHSGRLDIAVLFGESPDPLLVKHALLDEQLSLVYSPGQWTPPGVLTLADIADLELVLPSREHGLRRIIDEACIANDATLKVIAEIDSLPSVKRAVEAGIGATILPPASVAEEVSAGRLRAKAISGAGMMRRVVLATSSGRPKTRVVECVAGLACDVIEQMVRSNDWPGHWVGR